MGRTGRFSAATWFVLGQAMAELYGQRLSHNFSNPIFLIQLYMFQYYRNIDKTIIDKTLQETNSRQCNSKYIWNQILWLFHNIYFASNLMMASTFLNCTNYVFNFNMNMKSV